MGGGMGYRLAKGKDEEGTTRHVPHPILRRSFQCLVFRRRKRGVDLGPENASNEPKAM